MHVWKRQMCACEGDFSHNCKISPEQLRGTFFHTKHTSAKTPDHLHDEKKNYAFSKEINVYIASALIQNA